MRLAKWFSVMLVVAGFALLSAPPDARAALMLESVTPAPIPHRVFIDDNGGGTSADDFPSGPFVLGEPGQYDTLYDPITNPNGNLDGGPLSDPFGDTIAGLDLVFGPVGGENIATFAGIVSPVGITTSFFTMTSTSPGAGAGGVASIGINAGTIINNTAGTVVITVYFGDTDFETPLRGIARSSMSLTVANGTVTADYITWDDPANIQFGGSGPLAKQPSPGAIVIDTGSVSASAGRSDSTNSGDVPYSFAGHYSKTARYVLTLSPGATISSFGVSVTNTAVIPEPATMAMAFAGMPLLGFGLWRRQRRLSK